MRKPVAVVAAAFAVALVATGRILLAGGDASAVGGPTVPKQFFRCARAAGLEPQFDARYRRLSGGFSGGFRVRPGNRVPAVLVSVYSSEQDAARGLVRIRRVVLQHSGGGAMRHANVVVAHKRTLPRAAIARVLRCTRAG